MNCEHCDFCDFIDRDGLCTKDGCPVLVIDNRKRTKNYAYCKNNIKISGYGQMSYQKEVNDEKQN